MGKLIPFGVLKKLSQPDCADDIFVRVKAHKSDGWSYFGRQNSVQDARELARKFSENPIYIISVNGAEVEKRNKTRAEAIGGGRDPMKPWSKAPKVVMSGHVAGMKGERFDIATGFDKGPMELPPVTVLEEYRDSKERLKRREIRTPDNHAIVRVKGKAKRVRKTTPSHKWQQKASKFGRNSGM